MPESMFGRPSQHLLPCPQANAGGSSGASDPPVQSAPLPFKDFRFNSIGKCPELLSRISFSQPVDTEYRSPTPSPRSTPLPAFANNSQSKSSRPTLLQQLAVDDSDGGSRWNPSTSQSNNSLASRIQMSGSPPNDIANARGIASRFPSPPLRFSTIRRTTENSLIPPVEVLPQLPDSSPPTPVSWAPALEQAELHSHASSAPLMNTTTINPSHVPTPTITTNTTSSDPLPPSMAVVDTLVQDLQPYPSTTATIDSLVERQERLQSIRARLANLASPIPPRSSQSQSPPLNLSSMPRANADITPTQPGHPSRVSTPVVLHYPYSTNHSSDQVEMGINDALVDTDDLSLASVLLSSAFTQEYRTQSQAVVAAIQNLRSALNVAHSAHIDSEKALALRIQTFEEQRAAFEQRMRAEEDALQRGSQELQKKREELDVKEALLASLDKEHKAREEVKRGVLAKRQAQEEEKRAAEVKRVQELQEQITIAMNELKQIEALKAECQAEQLASDPVPGDLPTGSQEGMDEEEKAVIKSRSDLLCALKHLRRMHTDKVQRLEETNRTLRRLGEERKKREAEQAKEAEHRQVAAEECLRAHAELERACQHLDEKRHEPEAQRKRQEVENDREPAQLLVEQQSHAESQALGSGRVKGTDGQVFKQSIRPEEVGTAQELGIADLTRIRAVRRDSPISQEINNAMNVDNDGKALALHRTIPSFDIHSSPGASQSKQVQKDKLTGGVMLAMPTPKACGGHLPPKPLAVSPLLSSDYLIENVPNQARTPLATPESADNSHTSSFPAQLVSGFIGGGAKADIYPTLDYKPAFSRTPKSQTVLDATKGGSQELNIGPLAGVSSTQQNVNLRHLKRFRTRVEENDSGNRSVRTIQVKNEENDDQSREVVQASLSINPPASLPHRPAVIPPPRLRMLKKRHEAPASQTDSTLSYPSEINQVSFTREADVTIDEQRRKALHQDAPGSQAMDAAPVQPAPVETTSSLLLGSVCAEPQATESRINAHQGPTRDRDENYDTTPSELVNAPSSHEMDGADPSRSSRSFSDEHRRTHNANSSRRVSDHCSPPRPPVTSTTQPHRLTDSWRPRAEPMRATSPNVGRKRPFESDDNEHGHRARRQRSDVWIAPDDDRDRVDPCRPRWDRRPETESERRASYRTLASPLERIRPYPSDAPRATYDNMVYASEEPAASVARWEPSYGRTESDDTYHRYQPSTPACNTMADEHHRDDARVGQAYNEPMLEERMDSQPDPSLLARMHSNQRFPPRGRGRGEPSRGKGEYLSRGRGRGVARGGTPLIERLTSVPSISSSSLEHRLT